VPDHPAGKRSAHGVGELACGIGLHRRDAVTVRPERTEPGPGQESVWDYPRPPAVVPCDRHVRVVHAGRTVADTRRSVRILETSQPPAYYIPRGDCDETLLRSSAGSSFCEWKGPATYWSVQVGDAVVMDAAWSYEQPTARFATITGHLAFYAQKMDECWVDEEQVHPNPGAFYGGWITSWVVGPFKGAPGTMGW
jgi:uncharacterized protein (DUF427 family)